MRIECFIKNFGLLYPLTLTDDSSLIFSFIFQNFFDLFFNFFILLSHWNLRMCVVVCHQIDKIEVQTLKFFIWSYFKLSIIHLACFIKSGRSLKHLPLFIVVFYLLRAYHTRVIFVSFEAIDTNISFAFWCISENLASLSLFTLVADVASCWHCL